ncbi:MAG: TerD family protein [Lachnospiraceae bacterium]|nr:TerD family protein [Lachnospiraceae bacterium]
MSINLLKGQKINLSKENVELSQIMVGLGWVEVEKPKGFFASLLRLKL